MTKNNDRSQLIFGNEMPASVVKKAIQGKKAHVKKHGDDSHKSYEISSVKNETLGSTLGIKNIVHGTEGSKIDEKKGIILGNIRMGFGHYRIAMAIASAAHAKGLTPYWFDLLSFHETTGAKVIGNLNELYSLGSRLSQKYSLFNKLYWEPLNSEGFKKLSYNAGDQKMAELLTPIFANLNKNIPFIGTHAWPSQAAVHAGMKNVINMIPDNWPMALHLAEGSLHTIQCPSSYIGYRMLREFNGTDTALKMMPEGHLAMVGHYIDHEIVSNIEKDCDARKKRTTSGACKRLLLSVGGAGAQKNIFVHIIKNQLNDIKSGKLALYINIGDHKAVWDGLIQDIPELKALATTHFDDWDETRSFCTRALSGKVEGIHVFYNHDIFAAVYTTNLLLRSCDVLATKPSELAFYPVPKLFIKRIGGHEAWGAIRSAEIGDGTIECNTTHLVNQGLDLLLHEQELPLMMNDAIITNKKAGIYDGAYKIIDLALERQKKLK